VADFILAIRGDMVRSVVRGHGTGRFTGGGTSMHSQISFADGAMPGRAPGRLFCATEYGPR
jgi:hypothetical protein